MKKIKKELKKTPKKIITSLVVLAVLLNYMLPLKNVFADDGYTITFQAEDGHSMQKVEGHLKIDGHYVDLINKDYVVYDEYNIESGAVIGEVNCSSSTSCSITVESSIMVGYLNYNTNQFTLYNTNGHTPYSMSTTMNSNTVFLVEDYADEHEQQGGGSDTSNYQGNGVSTLNYSINGAIEYTSGGGFDHGISFRINDLPYRADESKMVYTEDTAYERDEHGQLIIGDNNQPIPVLDPESHQPMTEKTGLTITGDTINYDYDTTTNKVNFTFTMAPGTLMTGLIINGQTITNLPDTSDELLAHYNDHRIEIEVNNIDKADTYNIEITARYPNSNEEFMGNFLWDYNPQGYTGPEDKILNGKLEFVKAEYNGHVYTTSEEINALGGVYIWRDATRKKNYTDEREGVGEAQFPKGTILTVKIVPDAGYQLVDFGINGGVFDPQEEIGTYSFEVNGGPFHLQATIMQVEDVVKTKSEKVSAGAINLGKEQSMSIGTARLDVKDIDLTEKQINNFEEAANGYKVKNYLDISLFNTVYKGSSTQSWDTQVKDLDNEAEIFLQLEEDVNGEDIVIVHEKHDGTYEIIPTEYLKEYNAIVFKTKSFSNYAIATKTSTTIINKTSTKNNPKTSDNIVLYFSMLGLSIVGLAGAVLYIKKRKSN